MRLLLDTHTWFWSLQSPGRLGAVCRQALADPAHQILVATVSTLELAQLAHVGRLQFRGTVESWVRRGLVALAAETCELTREIALLAYALPGEVHRDPADRILLATAIHHGLTLVTADERLLAYPHMMTHDARV